MDVLNEMKEMGKKRYKKGMIKAVENDNESNTSYGVRLLAQRIEDVADKIEEYKNSCKKGKGTANGVCYQKTKNINSFVLAYLVSRTVLDYVSKELGLTDLSNKVGLVIEDEARTQHQLDQTKDSGLFKEIIKYLKTKNRPYYHNRKVLLAAGKRAGIAWNSWKPTELHQVGVKLIDLVREATGIIEFKDKPIGHNKFQKKVSPTESCLRLINDCNSYGELANPYLLPLNFHPIPWTNPYNGGYPNKKENHLANRTLVKTRDKAYLKKLKQQDMPHVYRTINKLQSTKWRINADILRVMTELANDATANIPFIPNAQVQVREPNKPPDIATNPDSLKDYKKKKSKYHDDHHRRLSQEIRFKQVIQLADKFKDEEEIYFPFEMDFRGRFYSATSMLSPQGDDQSKGLLEFGEGKPLGEGGVDWLKIHAANCYGFDKVSLAERVEWFDEHEQEIFDSATFPILRDFWKEADKPWMFLACCFEWKRYLRHCEEYEEPTSFLSHLCVNVDGSCNGLQHFSAMLRDDIGGSAVNILPGDKPNDIYGVVAEKVRKRLERDRENGGLKRTIFANRWLNYGVNRKLCKLPVMTLPYGATLFGFKEQLKDELYKSKDQGKRIPFDKDKVEQACNFLAKRISKALSGTVVAACEAMDWLKEVAKIMNKEGLPISWMSPSGFLVKQGYLEQRKKRIKTKLNGTYVYSSINVDDESQSIHKQKQVNSISPNFIHSLDASHLIETINRYENLEGIHFSMVHDSFGTHAMNVEELGEKLRLAFVEMYERGNWLKILPQTIRETYGGEVWDRVKKQIPPFPDYGTLDLREVLNSPYFFA